MSSILEFGSGAIANLVATFGIWGADLPKLQVYGAEGVLNGPDPNTFGGPISVNLHSDEAGWRDIPLAGEGGDGEVNQRGIGLIDLVRAAAEGRQARASGVLALHVLDVMQSVAESTASGRHVAVTSTCDRPIPLPAATHS